MSKLAKEGYLSIRASLAVRRLVIGGCSLGPGGAFHGHLISVLDLTIPKWELISC